MYLTALAGVRAAALILCHHRACGALFVGAGDSRRTPESCTSCAAQSCSSSWCCVQSGVRLLRWLPSPCPWYPLPWSSYRWRRVRGRRDARSCRRESAPAGGRVHPSVRRVWCLVCKESLVGPRCEIQIPRVHFTVVTAVDIPLLLTCVFTSLRCALYFTIFQCSFSVP